MNKSAIAIFGGSFNPPTIAHINLSKEILKQIDNVEKIIFVPVSTRYNKEGLVPDMVRLELLKKICYNEKKMEVSSLEIDSSRQLYTIETLEIFQKENPNYDIYFVLGTDNLKELETWHKPNEILKRFKIIVLERDEDIMENIIQNNILLKQYKENFIKINGNIKNKISASDVRKRIKERKNNIRLST